MTTVFTRDEQAIQWGPQQGLDCPTSLCPSYSGYLLKLGSNDKWQSRLFTFDGAVLTCVGKRPKAFPVATYDPHVSSPFVSAPSRPQPQNPNTKWSLNLSSIVDIRLLSSSKTYRCFPYNDSSRSLLIHMTDGRTLTLRAKKDLELERWHFVLFKLWSIQQQHLQERPWMQEQPRFDDDQAPVQQQNALAPHHANTGQQHSHPHPDLTPVASLLPAHQQSTHLFKKYLQRQHFHHHPQESEPAQPRSPQQQQQRRLQPMQYQQRVACARAKANDNLLQYQIPHPRASAFLPQGLDFAQMRYEDYHEEQDEGNVDDGDEENEDEQDIRVFIRLTGMDDLASSPQPTGWPTVGILEPAKAAAIDMWRRSLLSPLMRNRTRSTRSDDSECLALARATRVKMLAEQRRFSEDRSRNTFGVRFPDDDNDDDEKSYVREAISPRVTGTQWPPSNDPYLRPRVTMESASLDESVAEEHQQPESFLAYRRNHQNRSPSARDDDNLPLAMVHHRHNSLGGEQVGAAMGLGIQPYTHEQQERRVTSEENVPEPGRLHVNSLSRWQKTQLSSVDDTSTNRDSFAALTVTPDMSRNSFPTFPSRDSYLNLAGRNRDSYLNLSNNRNSHYASGVGHLLSDPSFSKKTHATPATVNASPELNSEKAILTSILKRPSLPCLDTSIPKVSAAPGPATAPPMGINHTDPTTLAGNSPMRSNGQERLSPELSDPSLSLHGSSYSYLPIHDPEFELSQQLETSDEQARNNGMGAGTVRRLSSPSLNTKNACAPTSSARPAAALDIARTTRAAASFLPPPPVRPPRRRPISTRSPQRTSLLVDYAPASISSPNLLPPKTDMETEEVLQTEVQRRNSAPAVSFLGLGIEQKQKRHVPDMDANPKKEDFLGKLAQQLVHTSLNDETESVLSDDSFCYF